METQTALVRTNGTVELHTVADVYLYLSLVVNPRHTERRDTLWLYKAFNNFCFLKLGMLVVNVLNRGEYLLHCL